MIVAVLDTGLDTGHPEFNGASCAGYDFVNNDADPSDDNGHGTHVAGTIGAATNNGVGVAGMSWVTRIMPVKVANSPGAGRPAPPGSTAWPMPARTGPGWST